MLHLTIIARIIDGLPLAASLEAYSDNPGSSSSINLLSNPDSGAISEYRKQAKLILKKFTPLSHRPLPTVASVNSDKHMTFHYTVDKGVCFLLLSDRSYPRVLAFAFLGELQSAFLSQYSNQEIQNANRPYPFIRFDSEITRLTKRYSNPRSLNTQANLSQLSGKVQSYPTLTLVDVLPDYKPSLDLSSKPRLPTMSAHILNSLPISPTDNSNVLNSLRSLYYGSRAEFVLFFCWVLIAWGNFVFDLPFGLGLYSVHDIDTSSVESVETYHSPLALSTFESVSNGKWEAGGSMNTADATQNDATVAGNHPEAVLQSIAFFYGLCGFWIILQIWNSVFRKHSSETGSQPAWKQFLVPSPPFKNISAILVHVLFTFYFVYRILSVENSAMFSYTRMRFYSKPLLLPHERSFFGDFLRLDLLLYWSYIVMGLFFCVTRFTNLNTETEREDRKLV